MCGIVGLFLKSPCMREALGGMFAPMLIEMTDRGPDSAGVAVYRGGERGRTKITAFHPRPDFDWNSLLGDAESDRGERANVEVNGSHAVVTTNSVSIDIGKLEADFPGLQVMSVGQSIEIYKETGLPTEIAEAFKVSEMNGTHAVGHTRMATESAVTTAGSHPFSTGPDFCLVHNGSLSNHNRLRDLLRRRAGIEFKTENDTEVAAAFISHRLAAGQSLKATLEDCVKELDGFYTFVVGTKNGFAVLRDPFACKPAVLAETSGFVAFASEYRALASLPGINEAEVWEPEPAVVYNWEKAA
ncbi:MAG: class II glutamine amidotransferase [Albidovulum sp.]|nr:class II glutamine amidotransferase [Albidovulum sp.]